MAFKVSRMSYICKVCGHVHDGNEVPDKCPVCGASAAAFKEFIDDNLHS